MIRLKSLRKEWLSNCNKLYPHPLVCIILRLLSFIIGDSDVDFLSSHLPTSPPIAPVLNVGLVSVGTEMTVACEIPFNLFAIKLTLTFINSNLTVDQVEGPVESLQQPSSILTGLCLLQISIFYFWLLCIGPSSSDLPTSLPIPSVLNAEVMPASQYSSKYSLAQI